MKTTEMEQIVRDYENKAPGFLNSVKGKYKKARKVSIARIQKDFGTGEQGEMALKIVLLDWHRI